MLYLNRRNALVLDLSLSSIYYIKILVTFQVSPYFSKLRVCADLLIKKPNKIMTKGTTVDCQRLALSSKVYVCKVGLD